MADSKQLGTGAASKAGEAIEQRSDKVNRLVEESVRGTAERSSKENEVGPRAMKTSLASAKATERKVNGVRTFGAPISGK